MTFLSVRFDRYPDFRSVNVLPIGESKQNTSYTSRHIFLRREGRSIEKIFFQDVLPFIYLMERESIAQAALALNDPNDLLSLLNQLLSEEGGGCVKSVFSSKQLVFYSDISWNKRLYKSFSIPKKSGGNRQILAPERNLKLMQRCVKRILQAIYLAPSCATGFIPNRSIVDNSRFHIGKQYVFNTDLKDFFTSISYDQVYNSLLIRPFEFSPVIAKIIAGICCTEICVDQIPQVVLPQGAPTSPIIANIVCLPLDRKCSGLAKRFGVSYSRYADDITFSGDKNMFFYGSDFMMELQRIIESQHFIINHDKDRVQNYAGRQVVTGIVVNNHVNVSKQYLRDIENLIFIWERYGREIARIKYFQSHQRSRPRQGYNKSFESIIKGRLAYMRMIKGDNNPTINKLISRFNNLLSRHISHELDNGR